MVDANGVVEPWQEQRRGRGWFVLLLGVVVFAAFGAVVGYAYFRGLPGIGGEPLLIEAAEGPYRLAPSNRGGLAVPNANSSIVTVLRPRSEPPRVERLLPPEAATALESAEPDTEAEAPITTLATRDGATGTPAAGGETAGVPAPGALYPRSKPVVPEPVVSVEPADTTISPVEPSAPPLEAATDREPGADAPDPPPPEVATSESPTTLAVPPPQALPAPPPSPAPASAPQRLVRVDPAEPTALRPAAGGGIYRLQLAAVRSDGGLTQTWADLRQRYPAALGGVNPQVERTDTTSGPLFRLQAGPFVSREAAVDACGSIRGSGGQCFIVGPIGP